MKLLPRISLAAALVLLLALSACGGGGGGGSTSAAGTTDSSATTDSGATTGTAGTTSTSGSGTGTQPVSLTLPALDLPPPTGPKVLVLYDAPAGSEYQKLGFSYAIMLRNLLGHFDADVDLVPVQQYQAGQVDAHAATFYLGSDYNAALPATFLHDAAATAKTLVWFKYNLWELANDASLGFGASHGIAFDQLRGMNAVPSAANPQPGFFDQVVYKSLSFVKYYNYDAATNQLNADPDIGVVTIADPAKAQQLVPIYDTATGEQAPYVVRAGNFWYVADVPFSFIGPRDRYLVIADLLHDMLGIVHAESHRAMVRLEDVDAKVSVQTMKKLTDLMEGKGIPFSVALIPHYKDPLGYANGGVPEDIPLAQATDLQKAASYATAHGGQVVMHGYTHQYGAQQNPWTGVSGDDYEFWDIVNNRPVAEDSQLWAYGRLKAGLAELEAANLRPIAWETPHYQASANTSKAVPLAFDTTYQRVVYYTADQPDFSSHAGKDFTAGQLFPYVIQRDWYNQRVLPENLGNIEYDIRKVDPMSFYNYTWQDIALNAQYAWVVRDGFASFFFHPFWAEKDMDTPGYEDFKSLLAAISAQGYTWVAPGSLK